MKKNIFIFCFILLISCGKETIVNDCFRGITINRTISLNLPAYSELQIPNNSKITNIQGRDVLIVNRGSSGYKAFDLKCPERDCEVSMSFDGLKMICSCSKKEYNSLNGSPINGKGCFALEYNVQRNGSTLHISR